MSEVDQIVEACGTQSVCLYDGASISNASELQHLLPDGVQVVVIPPPDQAQSVSSNSLASGIKSATGADTVIVIEDRATNDRFAVASNGDADKISEALYGRGEADGGAAVASIQSTLTPATTDGGGLPIGGIVGGAVGVVVVVAGVWSLVALLRKKKRGRAQQATVSARKLEKELAEALDGEDGRFVTDAVDRLEDRAEALPSIAALIMQLREHIADLFLRVRGRGTDQQLRLLQAQYKDTLSKLLKALDEDYLGDILKNPQYWSRPDERVAEVTRAVESVDHQAVENIKQVNESRDLEFQVALDSLTQSVDEAKLSDVYTDREK